jgi:hypothetical protein
MIRLEGIVLKSKSKRRKSAFICPFDGSPCDSSVPRGFTACPECPRMKDSL